jgi:flagellar hook-length control protein FliK
LQSVAGPAKTPDIAPPAPGPRREATRAAASEPFADLVSKADSRDDEPPPPPAVSRDRQSDAPVDSRRARASAKRDEGDAHKDDDDSRDGKTASGDAPSVTLAAQANAAATSTNSATPAKPDAAGVEDVAAAAGKSELGKPGPDKPGKNGKAAAHLDKAALEGTPATAPADAQGAASQAAASLAAGGAAPPDGAQAAAAATSSPGVANAAAAATIDAKAVTTKAAAALAAPGSEAAAKPQQGATLHADARDATEQKPGTDTGKPGAKTGAKTYEAKTDELASEPAADAQPTPKAEAPSPSEARAKPEASAPATPTPPASETARPHPAPLPVQQASTQPAAVPTVALPQLAVTIAGKAKAGESRFEIRLDPPDLGRIDVSLSVDKSGSTTTTLTVERMDTLDLLQRDSRALERALNTAGFKTDQNSLQFNLRDPGQNAQNFAGQQSGQDQGQPRRFLVTDAEAAAGAPRAAQPTIKAYAGAQLRLGGLDIRV